MATITEDYVSFEIAKLLKEKGFNERLLTFYITDEAKKEGSFQLMAFTDDKIDNNYSDYCYLAPTLQMAMKWLKKAHNIVVEPFMQEDTKYIWYIHRIETKFNKKYLVFCWGSKNKKYEQYEEACEAAIKYCLEKLI